MTWCGEVLGGCSRNDLGPKEGEILVHVQEQARNCCVQFFKTMILGKFKIFYNLLRDDYYSHIFL